MSNHILYNCLMFAPVYVSRSVQQLIFFTSISEHTYSEKARILSSFQPCNGTNDCLPTRQCGRRLWTQQVQLCLKLLCLNLSGQKGDYRKVAFSGTSNWARWKYGRHFWACTCVCVWNRSRCVWPEPRMKIAQSLWLNSLIKWVIQ